MLGHIDHGRTTLVSAMSKVSSTEYDGVFVPVEVLSKAPQTSSIPTVAMASAEIRSARRAYTLADFPAHADAVKALVTGAVVPAGVLLVVSVVDGPMPQTRVQLRLAQRLHVPRVVVALTKADALAKEEREALRLRAQRGRRGTGSLAALVEDEVRDLLRSYGFDGRETPIVRVSARDALRGDPAAVQGILRLMDAIDRQIAVARPLAGQPFAMPVEDVFSISGRGTAVSGRIDRGSVSIGDEVEIVGMQPTVKRSVIGLETLRKPLDKAVAGADAVAVQLRGVQTSDLRRGQVLVKPGSMTAHTRFDAEVYLWSSHEGGRSTPVFNGYRPQIVIRTTDVTGTLQLPPGTEMLMPGDHLSVTVTLATPMAIEPTSRFTIREGGRTVGTGFVVRVLQ